MSEKDKMRELYEQIHQIEVEKIKLWAEYVIFSWQWWLGVVLTIIPWLLWMIYKNKESALRLLTAGFFVMVFSSSLDALGTQLGLWYYQHVVIPFIPPHIPWNMTLMPVTIMFFLQIKPEKSPYMKALIFSLLTAYIAEPLFIWIGIYEPVYWKHIYSFPLYFIIYLIAHYLCHGFSFKEL